MKKVTEPIEEGKPVDTFKDAPAISEPAKVIREILEEIDSLQDELDKATAIIDRQSISISELVAAVKKLNDVPKPFFSSIV